jgi:hypothetical protein
MRLHLREMQATATARFGRAEAFRRFPVEITFSFYQRITPMLQYSTTPALSSLHDPLVLISLHPP